MNPLLYLLEKYPEKHWNWGGISSNPNITMEFIEKNINKIRFGSLSSNKFTYQNKLNRLKQQRQSLWLLENINTVKRLPKMVNRHIVRAYL